ncbi:PQ loop repeat family protein [Tritrichomonas foetus]|uniref:PQ loop repeat family protein n=1 Tax=Tritrichomonas foetus TaxID=1144522 RepID=A0A1J4L452_9EUKA|nr:PQ loop repeat family protein [Tritrichomonas foetus]|eukprot:OHT16701.1 PQ loop repeat family protein [Tritrichomonas foetus]
MPQCTGIYVQWIADIFGECISTKRDKASFILGNLSTIIWVYAQIPQIIMNFKSKTTDGLSFSFLCLLVCGDLCNLFGAYINGGLITQIITASWFVIVDCFCTFQYIYYVWIRQKYQDYKSQKQKNSNRYRNDNNYQTDDNVSIPSLPLLFAIGASKMSNDLYKPPHLYGMILGWMSCTSYMSSRFPQIIKNFQRKKTEGLSPKFFISAVLGNSTYAASIFVKNSSWNYIWSQFPWLLGSAGLLFFDFTVLIQFLVFGEDKHQHSGNYDTVTDIPSLYQ